MRKKIVIGLTLICIISIYINAFQFYKIRDYKSQEKLYTEEFQNALTVLNKSFDLYNSSSLSNESAIKNSVNIVGNLSSIRELSSYKESKSISEMTLYLSQFFTLNSNQYINENIDKVKSELEIIPQSLNDDNIIKNFNAFLFKMVSSRH